MSNQKTADKTTSLNQAGNIPPSAIKLQQQQQMLQQSAQLQQYQQLLQNPLMFNQFMLSYAAMVAQSQNANPLQTTLPVLFPNNAQMMQSVNPNLFQLPLAATLNPALAAQSAPNNVIKSTTQNSANLPKYLQT